MLNSVQDFRKAQEKAFAECEDFIPRIEKIKEADKIGREVLSFIDENIQNADMKAFDEIDVSSIVENLHIEVNDNLDGDVLSSIYDEINDTFSQGGRVNLEDYLAQGMIALNDMMYELKGEVDYSIDYSERKLKEEEKRAFERFNVVLSMKNLKDTAFCFDISENNAGDAYVKKAESYLSVLNGEPFADTIEEKLSELNNCILLVQSLEEMGIKVKEKAALNDYFTEKVANVVEDLSRYKEDANIRQMFDDLQRTAMQYSENEIIQNLKNNLDLVREQVLEADFSKNVERDKDKSLVNQTQLE